MVGRIIRNSLGDYVCPVCKKVFLTLPLAEACVAGHVDSSDDLFRADVSSALVPVVDAFKAGDSMRAGFILVERMIEDYHICRQSDFAVRGKPGPLTLQFAKNASEALNALNKLVYGEKSSRVNVSLKGGEQVDELSALKDLLVKGKKKDDKFLSVDGDG